MNESSELFGHRPCTLNSAALIVRPKQPHVDWATSVDNDGRRAFLQELRTDPSIYPVETIDLLEDFGLLIDDTWERIFREQLNGWMRNPDLWPEGLTREMFLESFDCELSTMIWDMLKAIIKPAS